MLNNVFAVMYLLCSVMLVCAVADNEGLRAQLAADPEKVHAIAALAECNYAHEMKGQHGDVSHSR